MPSQLQPLLALFVATAFAACSTVQFPPRAPQPTEPAPKIPAPAVPAPAIPAPAPPSPTPSPPAQAPQSPLVAVTWQDLQAWGDDDPSQAWSALLTGCGALKTKVAWVKVCTIAAALDQPDRDTARRFFETYFTPYRVRDPEGGEEGLVTGYYEPLLNGSRKPSGRFRYPLYGVPDDMLTIDLGDVYPQLKGMRLRGRLQGKRVVPY